MEENANTILQNIQLKDLLEYYGEKVTRHGTRYYKLIRHDSLIIKDDIFYWNSRHVGGNAINLMKELYDKSLDEARVMVEKYVKELGKTFKSKKEEKIEIKKFEINIKDDFEKIKEYLCDKRKLSVDIVKPLYDKKLIQIDRRNNILFTIKDKYGDVVGYDIIGTSEKRFRANTSLEPCGTNFYNSINPKELYLFEAPIDVLSYLEMKKEDNKIFEKARFLSLSGLREDIAKHYLTKELEKIVICVDNDEAGNNFTKEIKEKYKDKYIIEREIPKQKDWNDDLKGRRVRNVEKDPDMLEELVKVKTPIEIIEFLRKDTNALVKNLNSGDIVKENEKIRIDNEEIMQKLVEKDGWYLEHASEKLKDNKKIVLEAVKNKGRALTFASNRLKDDEEIVLAAIENSYDSLAYASEILRNDKDIVLKVVNINGRYLKNINSTLLDDKDIVLAAIKNYCDALQYASERLKDDKEVVLESLKEDGYPFRFASERLRNDKEVVIKAIKKDDRLLKFASRNLRNDKEVVLEAVKSGVQGLQYASKNLRNDKEVVLGAVKRHGEALQFASKDLQNNEEIALAAVKQYALALKYVEYDAMRNNKEITIEAIRQDPKMVSDFMLHEDRTNKEIILVGLESDPSALPYLLRYKDNPLLNDREIISFSVKGCPSMIKYASKELQEEYKKNGTLEIEKESSWIKKNSDKLER